MGKKPITWDGNDAQGKPLRWDSGLKWNGFLPTNQPKAMFHLRVLLGFAAASDHSLEETATSVLSKLYNIADFANPPLTKVDLQAALSAFSLAIAAALHGGPVETADKNNKRDALIALLRQLAGFVQDEHGNDLSKLLSTGFEAVSTNRASVQLEAPKIKDILNGMTCQLIVRVGPVANAKCYEVRYALIAPGGALGPLQNGGLHTSSRSMPIGGLTPGGNYQFQVRAIGGSTGYSDWSDPVSHMSL
ncbi:MAG: fibronectin type III domain-containing protein [Verrucomicrobia bacterium]|nr:fibronectin type III domain-containing protein [Verrucomicrobiota bacterium]